MMHDSYRYDLENGIDQPVSFDFYEAEEAAIRLTKSQRKTKRRKNKRERKRRTRRR